jgi:hypothetical protein
MYEFDASTALARIEQRFVLGAFPSTYPTCVRLICILSFVFDKCIVGWVIHDIWLAFGVG